MEKRAIDIRTLKSMYINLDSAVTRQRKFKAMAHECGINPTRFPGHRHDIGIIGCAMSHLDVLKIIEENTLVFEDDVVKTQWYTPDLLDVPECDALYLGVSNHGYIRAYGGGVRGTVLATQETPLYKRVFNMCGGHAIIYRSERYIEACIKKIMWCLKNSYPFDLGLAALHKDFTILTPNNPLFYQEGQPTFTNFSLEV
jgi:hypothetical protein